MLVGQRTADGRILYCGAVGSGFTQHERADLAGLLRGRLTTTTPFAGPAGRACGALFVRPDRACEIEFLGHRRGGARCRAGLR
ncbi:hypothetical protein AB0D08_34565 [Kitasatospora sp. NPDC048540]|uniref:ATP dependent DNA ligase n=1 Tax=Kitasatospora sp. NPDC048540 TaxID=3155634 RepID=UPI0033E256EE